MNKTKVGKQQLTENGLTRAEERAILKAHNDAMAGKGIAGPFTLKELYKYLKSQ